MFVMDEDNFTSVVDVAFSYSYALKGSSFWHTKGDCSSHVLLVVNSNKEMVFFFHLLFPWFIFFLAMTENTVNWNRFAMNRSAVYHSPIFIERAFSSSFSLFPCLVSFPLSLCFSVYLSPPPPPPPPLSLSLSLSLSFSVYHYYLLLILSFIFSLS